MKGHRDGDSKVPSYAEGQGCTPVSPEPRDLGEAARLPVSGLHRLFSAPSVTFVTPGSH